MKNYAALLKKYDVPVPRYTSYPTVPQWQTQAFDTIAWQQKLKLAFDESNEAKGISLYIHLPFCESLCTYCACNTRITKNHSVEEKYIKALMQEWSLYESIFQTKPILRELHIGGGTPTFFNADNLDKLLTALLSRVNIHPEYEFSLEGHPNNTMSAHLDVLQKHGFKRISFGVQDLSEQVQKAIHRIQPFENLERVVLQSRERGFTSVSFDLIYGLPFQTIASVADTMKQVLTLRPDRISFYSYAHVPWLKPGQRGYEDADLPGDMRKRTLYETGRSRLIMAGYVEIGMDHFALPHDSLFKAQRAGKLHRNFMGYTTTNTDILIGLGASSISETTYGYAQNIKEVEAHQKSGEEGLLPVLKGHLHEGDDRLRKDIILSLSCHGFARIEDVKAVVDEESMDLLEEMQQEGLLRINHDAVRVTQAGFTFIRNICQVFDAYADLMKDKVVYSKAI
ncbi:oxygen-independent coproporphyrinogen III oxidase [Chryseotalea sanaruensis]|uniref:Coproporphyrinogen-III oxidase n=1 Tax=Chryseotalea sanaruensis TaxID=2482724 RepID=A0A401UBV8_9BACT|nr:oxygen-independent coproporphyrinogen III oxidase [Chryseotalea sanaruensis]GCC52386.1 oxygen-independent coproporphyrinogen III oxidase [Chryseotalea sanaruensis]